MAYTFNEKCPIVRLPEITKIGIITGEAIEVRGVFPFGPQCNIITDKELNEGSMAEYLLGKDEYKELITEVKESSDEVVSKSKK